jgi:hypothetical protein
MYQFAIYTLSSEQGCRGLDEWGLLPHSPPGDNDF